MSSVSSEIDLYDSDILAIDRGPLAWARIQQGTAQNVDGFVRSLEGKFEDIGLRSRVNTYDTTEGGTYYFEIVITGRMEAHAFDYDKMVHEVTSNILGDPDQPEGFIKTDAGALTQAARTKHKC